MTSTSHRILVIDDNQTVHQDFRKILTPVNAARSALDEMDAALFGEPRSTAKQLDFEIHSAFQGQEGLSLVEENFAKGLRFPVAFVDVRMPPGWDGIETVGRIWKVDPDIQIVICTAYSEYSWDDMISKLGQSDNLLILKKPFDNIEVQQLANALTEKWHLLQQKKNQIELLEQKVKERTLELEKATEALRESQQTVLRQERLAVVGQLSAGVAHEFNNILTVIQGHASLLLDTGDYDESTIRSLKHIASGSERAALLTKQMLAFSRKQLLHYQSLDIAATVARMAEMLRPALCENISLVVQCNPALPAIWADPSMIEQVIMNLVVNARDALSTGGEVKLSARAVALRASDAVVESGVVGSSERREGSFVCLTVQDNGKGMNVETMQRAFEPFFTTKDVGKGTGLGLATVYGIVQQHEGWIELSSSIGKGTTFNVYLPQSMDAAAAEHGSTPAQPATPVPESQTILVVEDEPIVRSLVSSVLLQCGYNVFEAASGPEALEVCERNNGQIDLLFTDMMMPHGISGRELAERLQAMSPELKVVYTSGYSEDIVKGAVTKGQSEFLEKPYKPARLVEVIRRCLQPLAQ